jgi:hypothetical protein
MRLNAQESWWAIDPMDNIHNTNNGNVWITYNLGFNLSGTLLNANAISPWGIPSLKLSNTTTIGNSLQFESSSGLLAIDFWHDGSSGIMDFYADYQNNPTFCQFSVKSDNSCGWGNDWSWLAGDKGSTQGASIHLNQTGLNSLAQPYISFAYGITGNNGHNDVVLKNSAPNQLDFYINTDQFGENGTKIMSIMDDAVVAKKLIVQTTWPDFVFKKDYYLKPLNEVEDYINKNGHLEGIPDEKEISEKGVDLGDITSKLLQKIEDLNLYIIDLNKKLEILQTENKTIKNLLNNK